MDSLIAAAARALARGDTARRAKEDLPAKRPPALALCGIAMAQLGERPTGTAWVYTASCPLKS
jgi:hypothetical protein